MPRGVYKRKKVPVKKTTTVSKPTTATTGAAKKLPVVPTLAPRQSVINPKHYDIIVKGQPIQVVDLIEAIYPEDAHMSQALKYMLRAGRKTDASFVQDMQKCIWWCVRALMFQKVKHIELPKDAPVK